MTTVRDLLRDFQLETIKRHTDYTLSSTITEEEVKIELEELVEEYIRIIKDRIIG